MTPTGWSIKNLRNYDLASIRREQGAYLNQFNALTLIMLGKHKET